MLLKVILGQEEWLILNGNCHAVHLRQTIQGRCPRWPEGAVLDLCDIDTGTLMGMHNLGPWEMAGPCFKDMETQKKIFTPLALTIENDVLLALEPMMEHFEEKFPEPKGELTDRSHAKSLLPPPLTNKERAKAAKSAKKNKDKKPGKK